MSVTADIAPWTPRHQLPSGNSRRKAWLGAATLLVVVALTLCVVTVSHSSATFVGHGSVAVEGATISGTSCDTADSVYFSDVDSGIAVRISNAEGAGIGTAVLGNGRYDQADQLCVFTWSTKLPANLSSYSVTISHRGTLVYSRTQLEAGVHSMLGDSHPQAVAAPTEPSLTHRSSSSPKVGCTEPSSANVPAFLTALQSTAAGLHLTTKSVVVGNPTAMQKTDRRGSAATYSVSIVARVRGTELARRDVVENRFRSLATRLHRTVQVRATNATAAQETVSFRLLVQPSC